MACPYTVKILLNMEVGVQRPKIVLGVVKTILGVFLRYMGCFCQIQGIMRPKKRVIDLVLTTTSLILVRFSIFNLQNVQKKECLSFKNNRSP